MNSLETHSLYSENWDLQGYTLFFSLLAQNHTLVFIRTASLKDEQPQTMFGARIMKI